MSSIIINELKKPFFHKFFLYFLGFVLIGNLILCASLLAIQKNSIDFFQNPPTGEYYTERLNSICSEAELNKLRLLRLNVTETDFAYRYQNEIINQYTHLQHTVEIIPDYVVDGWSVYFQYSYSNIFSILGSLIFICSTIIYDRTIGMWNITRTTHNGRGLVYIGKGFSVFLLSFIFSILCQLTVFFVVWYIYGLSTPFVDIQNIPIFLLSTFDGSIFSFFILTLFQQSFIIATYSIIIAAIASLLGRYFPTIVLGAAIYSIGVILYYISPSTSWKYLNFYESLNPSTFFSRFEAVNAFGKPVSALVISIIFTLFVSCISFITIIIGLAKPISQASNVNAILKYIKRPTYSFNKKYESHSLVKQELYKTFSPRIILALILCFGFHIYTDIVLFQHTDSYQTKTLKEYSAILSNMENDEQNQYIVSEFDRLGNIINAEAEMTDLYFNGKITAEEFNDYNRSFHEASAKLQPLAMLQSRLSYLQKMNEDKNLRGQLIFDFSIEKLISGTSPIGIYICIVLLSCTIAAVDYQKKDSAICFWDILSTTKNGRKKTLQLKLSIVCVSSSILALIFALIDIFFYIHTSDTPSFSISLISFPAFSSTDSNISVFFWYFIELIFKILFSCGLGTFSFCMMLSIRNTLYSYVIILIGTLLPKLLSQLGVSIFYYVDPLMLLSSPQLYQISSQIPYFDYTLNLVYLLMIYCAIICFTKKCFWQCEHNV